MRNQLIAVFLTDKKNVLTDNQRLKRKPVKITCLSDDVMGQLYTSIS